MLIITLHDRLLTYIYVKSHLHPSISSSTLSTPPQHYFRHSNSSYQSTPLIFHQSVDPRREALSRRQICTFSKDN